MAHDHLGRSPAQRTYLLAGGLAGAAALIGAVAPRQPIFPTPVADWLLVVALAVAFLLGEQLLMNVEFRGEAYSLTLAGIPLTIGILVAPVPNVVAARVVGAGLALILQRVGTEKLVYNTAAYAFEAALDGVVAHALLGQTSQLDAHAAAVILAVVVACDQLMSGLVLLVIKWHGGPLSSTAIRDVLVPACVMAVVSTSLAFGVLLLTGVGPLGIAVMLVFAGVAVFGYRTYVRTHRRHQRLELLHEFVNGSLGAASLDDVARDLLARIRSLLRAASAELLLITEDLTSPGDRKAQRVTRMTDDESGFVVGEHELVLEWTIVRAIDQAEPLLASRTSKDRGVRGWLNEHGYRDAIIVPLPASSGFVGTLTVINRLGETATFTQDDLTLLQTLTGHLAVAGHSARLVERLGYDATHDALTGLANRAQLSRQIAAPRATPDSTAGVLLIDLDRFKEVNDGLGHDAGDRLLVVIAQRLSAFLPSDATVARLGGDEFAALLPDIPGGKDAARRLVEELAAELARPVTVEEAMLTPDVSIGLALAGPHADTSDLLRQADTAMYAAKTTDGTIALYDPDMDRGRLENLALLADLRVTLRDHPEELAVYYQPKIDLQTRRVVSAEALVRWNHATLGVLSPDRFIPLAETTGLIEQFTPVVLAAALAQCRRWRDDGHDISVAVNLSARNVGNPRLPERVAQALAHARVPASSLILEITESSIIADPVQTLQVLHALADLGVTISLDDFGTGYSSLSYLQRLPVREVKIDRSFVQGLTGDDPRPSRALIASIASLGASLGLRVVAEGVETASVLDELSDLGCDIGQGYHIARPVPHDAFSRWLAERPAANRGDDPALSLVVG